MKNVTLKGVYKALNMNTHGSSLRLLTIVLPRLQSTLRFFPVAPKQSVHLLQAFPVLHIFFILGNKTAMKFIFGHSKHLGMVNKIMNLKVNSHLICIIMTKF